MNILNCNQDSIFKHDLKQIKVTNNVEMSCISFVPKKQGSFKQTRNKYCIQHYPKYIFQDCQGRP